MGNITKTIWSVAAAGHLHNTRKIRDAIDAQNAAMGIKTPSQIRAEERITAAQARRHAQANEGIAKARELRAQRAAEKPRTVQGAYLWWLISVFGILGGHYIYLGLPKRGILAFFTGGFLAFTIFVDPFRLPKLVREVNNGER